MPNFQDSLEYGSEVEKLVLDRVRESDPFALLIKGKFPKFDIYCPSSNTRIEVKSDQQSNHTGNFLIEVYMYHKPSALLVTEADIWVFYDGSNLIWVNPNDIKDHILEKGYPQRTLTGKGDTTSKRCYLIPVSAIYQISTKMESINEVV
tara:strand:- start:3 stop:449 length:447 start_codon:yes stop_codon:yes gene_type:complete